jgi:hypothetical protein
VEEDDYWVRLEFRICAEVRGFDDLQLRGNWCDGLVAEEYDLLPPKPCIRGRAWFGPDGQQPWEFSLLVDPNTRSRTDIDWAALLPGDRSTGWLSPDPQRKTMTIDPLGGHPD